MTISTRKTIEIIENTYINNFCRKSEELDVIITKPIHALC